MALITISKKAFLHNLNIFKNHIKKINDKMHIAAVLKDNAYGHGLEIMASLCAKNDIKHIFVKNFDEILRLQNANLLQDFESVNFFYGLPSKEITQFDNVYITIHDIETIDKIKHLAINNALSAELKVNIGMNRNGMAQNMLFECYKKALDSNIQIRGIFAHNGFGDNDGNEFYKELENFENLKEKVRNFCIQNNIDLPRFHSLNTSSCLRVKNTSDDVARIGIGLYGYLHSEVINCNLMPILKLYAHKVSTKHLKTNDAIGYGGATRFTKDTIVSTYDIGYGDGFYRVNKNKTLKTPNGLQILPVSSMDCVSIKSNEDEICLMDDAKYVGEIFDTISYEVLTRLSPFIKRIIIE